MSNKPKDELKAIHYAVTGTTIKPTDTVSGAFYLRLSREYRAYDRKRKAEYLALYQEREEQREYIATLIAEKEELRADLKRNSEIFKSIVIECRSKDLVSRQREHIANLLAQNTRLKEQIKQLIKLRQSETAAAKRYDRT